jgi:hypothetical protein
MQWCGFADLIQPMYAWANMGHPFRVGVSERTDCDDTSECSLTGQGEAEEVAAGRDGYKLVAVHCVAHR